MPFLIFFAWQTSSLKIETAKQMFLCFDLKYFNAYIQILAGSDTGVGVQNIF